MTYLEIVMGLLLYVLGCAFCYVPNTRVITMIEETPVAEIEMVEIPQIEIEELQTYKSVQGSDDFLEYGELVTSTIRQLKGFAGAAKVKGYGRFKKEELVRALMV